MTAGPGHILIVDDDLHIRDLLREYFTTVGDEAATPRLLAAIQGFRQGLREFGYVEGRTLTIEYRAAEGKPERILHSSRIYLASRWT